MAESSEKEAKESYNYLLIEFLTRGKQSKKLVDAVPSSWVTYDDKTKKFTCQFPPKPYKNFNKLVKEKAAADKSWETFNVKIRGCAVDYKKALSNLEKLKKKENAFSTDTEADSLQKTDHLERILRIEHLNKSLAETKSFVLDSTSESDEPNRRVKKNTLPKKLLRKTTSSSESRSCDSSQTSLVQGRKSKSVKQRTLDNVGKEIIKSSTSKKKEARGKKHESAASKSLKQKLSKSGGQLEKASVDQFDLDQTKKFLGVNQNSSAGSQTFPVSNSQFSNDGPGLADKNNFPLDFEIDAIIDENGLLVFPDSPNHQRTYVESTVDRAQGKSAADQGVFLSHDQFLALMKELTSLKIEQRNQSKLLAKMEKLLEQKCEGTVDIKSTWTRTFGFDFPLSDIETLYELEQKLAAHPELKTNFCSPMTLLTDTDDTLQKNVNAVVKKIVSRDLALNFTATRKMADKIVFSLNVPNIYRCILDTLIVSLGKSESKVTSAIGTAFTQSQYWEGHRNKISSKKDNELVDEFDMSGDDTNTNKQSGDSKKAKSLKLKAHQ